MFLLFFFFGGGGVDNDAKMVGKRYVGNKHLSVL